MRVLIISEPGYGGVFRYVKDQIRFLDSQGVNVDFFYSSNRSNENLYELVKFVKSRGGFTYDMRIGNVPSLKDLIVLLNLISYTSSYSPDIIYSHSAKAGIIARLFAYLLRFPRIYYTPHAYYGLNINSGILPKISILIENFFANVGTTICNSHDEMQYARESLSVHPRSITFSPLGVKLDKYNPETPLKKLHLRREFGLPDSEKIIGVMSRFTEQKDLLTLLEALYLIKDQDYRLFIVAEGPLKTDFFSHVERLHLSDRIRYLPQIDDPAKFYQCVDFVVLTSKYEAGIPYVAIEAMAFDLPLVFCECPGLRELKRFSPTSGYSYPIGDLKMLSRHIKECIEMDGDKLGSSNHRDICKAFFDINKTPHSRTFRQFFQCNRSPVHTH